MLAGIFAGQADTRSIDPGAIEFLAARRAERSFVPVQDMLRTVKTTRSTAADQRLARLAAAGDERAFTVIYERYAEPLYRYCHAITRHDEDAHDALQGTMLKALRAFREHKQVGLLKPWLYRIAHNESVSLLRRRRPHAEISEQHEPTGDETDRVAAARARLFQLIDDVAQLPERQRGMLVMRELEGLEYEQIGDAFSVSPAAAKQHVYEARRALAEQHEGRGLSCESVERVISGGDRRQLRGRRVRAHLRACLGCREFNHSIGARTSALAGLTPPLPLALSGGLALHALRAGAGWPTAAAGSAAASSAGVAGGIGGWAKGLAAGGLTKSIATGAAVLAVGGAAGVAVTQGERERGSSQAWHGTSGAPRGAAASARATADSSAARRPDGAAARRPDGSRADRTSSSAGGAHRGPGTESSSSSSSAHGGGAASSGGDRGGGHAPSQSSQTPAGGSDAASQVGGIVDQVTSAAPPLPPVPSVPTPPTPPVSVPLPAPPSLP